MFVYGRSVLGLRFGLLILFFYSMESFVLRVTDDPLFSEFTVYAFFELALSSRFSRFRRVMLVETQSSYLY